MNEVVRAHRSEWCILVNNHRFKTPLGNPHPRLHTPSDNHNMIPPSVRRQCQFLIPCHPIRRSRGVLFSIFRLINGVNTRGRVSPTLKHRSQSPFPISRSIYVPPEFPTKPFKARRKMAQVIPQTRPLSEVEPDRSDLVISVEKRPRLVKKQASKRKEQKHLLPEPHSYEDVLG